MELVGKRTVPYRTVLYRTVLYRTAQYCTVRYGTVQYGADGEDSGIRICFSWNHGCDAGVTFSVLKGRGFLCFYRSIVLRRGLFQAG